MNEAPPFAAAPADAAPGDMARPVTDSISSEPSGAANPFGQSQPQAPANPFAPPGESASSAPSGLNFSLPNGADSPANADPAGAAAIPQWPQNPAPESPAVANAFDPGSLQQSANAMPSATHPGGNPGASGTPHPNFGEVPDNPQSSADLDSFLKAATKSETEARSQQRKPRPVGMALRVAAITLGLGVAGVALLLIDYKFDGITVLHKVPGFTAISGKFQSFLPTRDDAKADPPAEVASASAAPEMGNGASTTAAAQVQPKSDAALAASDATDNGEDTIPLATNSLTTDAATAIQNPGGDVGASTALENPGSNGGAPASTPGNGTPERTVIGTTTANSGQLAQPGTQVGSNANTPGSVNVNPDADPENSATPSINDITSPGPANAGLFPNGNDTSKPDAAPAGATPPESAQPAPPKGVIVLDPPNQVGNAVPGGESTLKSTTDTGSGSGSPLPESNSGAMAAASSALVAKPAAVGPLRELAPGPLAEQRSALVSFLNGANWQERLPYTYRAESLKNSIEAYYKDHPDQALSEHELEFFHLDESTENGGPYWIFFVTTPAAPDGYPAIVRRTPDGFKVDWECFVEFNDRLFVNYFESGEAGPKQFRVVLKRTDYWGPDRPQFTTLNNYICYRVELPYTDLDHYAFVPLDDPLADELSQKVTWGMPPLASIVSFERVNFEHGKSHLKIVDLVTDGWHSPSK